MASKLTVIFYIILCLEAGIVLTVLPWVHPFGIGDWGDNFFLLYASQKVGLQGLQHAVSSGWMRGAVTGLGLLNLTMAFWEIAHFRQTVQRLQAQEDRPAAIQAADSQMPTTTTTDATSAATSTDAGQLRLSDDLSHYERRDDTRHNSVE
ncbi:MAG TPA: hypothetical protein VF666_14250 [Pyrinomonadaceae bacterium]|jgi:hypothetical protein